MNRRNSDADGDFRFRADRFFHAQGGWYCNTREGKVLGPFRDRESAESGLSDYLHELNVRIEDVWDRLGVVR